jgi:hypothetical protein
MVAGCLGLSPLAASANTADPGTAAGKTNSVMAPLDVVETFKGGQSGGCLDDNDNPGGGLHTQGCNGGGWQNWKVHTWADATRELRNTVTGRCLDFSYSGSLRTFGCNQSTYQSWFVSYYGGGVVFRNQFAGNLCLEDVPGSRIHVATCNSLLAQEWF